MEQEYRMMPNLEHSYHHRSKQENQALGKERLKTKKRHFVTFKIYLIDILAATAQTEIKLNSHNCLPHLFLFPQTIGGDKQSS